MDLPGASHRDSVHPTSRSVLSNDGFGCAGRRLGTRFGSSYVMLKYVECNLLEGQALFHLIDNGDGEAQLLDGCQGIANRGFE